MSRPLGLRAAAACALALVAALLAAAAASAAPLSGAIQTSALDGYRVGDANEPTEACTVVNANTKYGSKQAVYLNGGPNNDNAGSGLPDGTYFVQVTDPSGATVLGTSVGSATPRPISATGGTFDFCYQLWSLVQTGGQTGYLDTPNNGGEYKVWVSTSSLFPNDETKTDNFKVFVEEPPPPPPVAADLVATKTATASFDRTYDWSLTKSLTTPALVKQVGGSASVGYSVAVTRGAAQDSGWNVSGTISVDNPNDAAVRDVDVTDTIADPNASCVVTNGTDRTIPANGSIAVAYACSYTGPPAAGTGTNTARVTWDRTFADGSVSPNGSTTAQRAFTFSPTVTDDCVSLTDTFGGSVDTTTAGVPTGTICASQTFTYSRTIAMPAFDCATHTNTAAAVEVDSGTQHSDNATVTLCGPARTGARTIGFWQNKNGQDIITSSPVANGVCALTTWLRGYAPFTDLRADASCRTVGTWVSNVIKAANASGASMNAMLKAQMLATALDVYFSDPALGGNRLLAPSPLGSRSIDLTLVCKLSLNGGCSAMQDVSSVFGGSPKTVSEMLTHAAAQFSGGVWYGNVKATQELAKNAFDAINNEKVFAATTP